MLDRGRCFASGPTHLEHARVVAGDVEDAASAVEDIPGNDDGAEGEADLACADALEDEKEDQDGAADAHHGICKCRQQPA